MAKAALNKLSTTALKAELQRRQRELGKLQRKRDRLASQLAELDHRIADLDGAGAVRAGGAPAGAGVRRRPRNKMPLAETLLKVFPKDKPMKVSDAVAAVKKQGYRTNARNFATIVNQTLIKDPRFEQVSRGYYKVAKS